MQISGKSMTQALEMITKAFGDESMSHTRVFEWKNQTETEKG
jgi:hypothetical protein